MTLSACAGAMKSSLLDTFLHFWALFSHLFAFLHFLLPFWHFLFKKKVKITCQMSKVTCHMSHITFHHSLTPTATDLSLLTHPLTTVDWFQINKAPINHGHKTLVKSTLLLNRSCNFDILLDLKSLVPW